MREVNLPIHNKLALTLMMPFAGLYCSVNFQGMYDENENEIYIKDNLKGLNMFGDKTLTPSSVRRRTLTHELVESYLNQKWNSTQQSLTNTSLLLRYGKLEGRDLEKAIVFKPLTEGLCEFASIYTEMELVRNGSVKFDESPGYTALTKYLIGRHIKRDELLLENDLPVLKLNNDLVKKNRIRLERAYEELSDNSSGLQRLAALSLLANPYNVGFNFVYGSFDLLQSRGLDPSSAFHFMVDNPVETINELVHPEHYVTFRAK